MEENEYIVMLRIKAITAVEAMKPENMAKGDVEAVKKVVPPDDAQKKTGP